MACLSEDSYFCDHFFYNKTINEIICVVFLIFSHLSNCVIPWFEYTILFDLDKLPDR